MTINFYYKVREYLHKNNKNSLSFSTILMYTLLSYLIVSIIFWVYFREITDFLEGKYCWFFIIPYSIYLSIFYFTNTKSRYNIKINLFNFIVLVIAIFIYKNEELFPTKDVITCIFQIILIITFIIVLIENDQKIVFIYNKLKLFINKYLDCLLPLALFIISIFFLI